MKMKLPRALCLCALMMLLAVMTSGCLFEQAEDLYALPILPEGYSELQSTIQQVMDEQGAEYATITGGSNTSTVQLLDMNGDGVQEMAAVFFRVTTAEEKPLRVCLFRRDSDNAYHLAYVVEGDGTSINSVAYEDVTGDGRSELIVSWQMSTKVHILSVYTLLDSGVYELINTTYNESYLTADLDGDSCREVVVFHQGSTGEGGNRAELYDYQDGLMTMVSAAPLSDGVKSITSAKAGALSDGAQAIYVNSLFESGVLTDILTMKDGKLINITRDETSGVSQITTQAESGVTITDINKDGVLEVPMSVWLPALDEDSEPDQMVIYWRQFDSSGKAAVSCATYHSQTDGWYLMLPSNWPDNITVSRDDSLSHRGERSVVFYYLPEGEDSQPEPFLTIYRLTGNNRYSRAMLPGRVTLLSDSSIIYSAQLDGSVWDCGLGTDELSKRFFLITTEWSSQ